MEKTETHLRGKPGEFVRAQVWKITCNSWVYEKRRSALHRKSALCYSAVKERPTPTAEDMEQMGMTIARQAKKDGSEEKWVENIGVSSKNYKLSIEPPAANEKHHKNFEDMSVLRILYQGKKVCMARKQRFAGTLGRVCRPYLGVQIMPRQAEETKTKEASDEQSVEGHSLLDTHQLMLLPM